MRRENRAKLREKLLREVWGEEVEKENVLNAFELELSEGVMELMENRLILMEDIRRLIDRAEKTGNKLVNPATGRFLAYHRSVSVTYWVEYSTRGNNFEIYNVYSHRMRVTEDVKP